MADLIPELEGTPVKVGRKVFIVPPMTIGDYRRTKADRALLADASLSDEDKIDAGVRVIFLSIKRNYPELELEEIESRVTLGNFARILPQITRAWVFDPEGDGEKKAQAETLSTSTNSVVS